MEMCNHAFVSQFALQFEKVPFFVRTQQTLMLAERSFESARQFSIPLAVFYTFLL